MPRCNSLKQPNLLIEMTWRLRKIYRHQPTDNIDPLSFLSTKLAPSNQQACSNPYNNRSRYHQNPATSARTTDKTSWTYYTEWVAIIDCTRQDKNVWANFLYIIIGLTYTLWKRILGWIVLRCTWFGIEGAGWVPEQRCAWEEQHTLMCDNTDEMFLIGFWAGYCITPFFLKVGAHIDHASENYTQRFILRAYSPF